MKKKKKNSLFKVIFFMFFFSFLVIYFSEVTGYYEYQNHQKKTLTEEQIKKFEADVASGKEVDLTKYLVVEDNDYNNKLSKLTYKISQGISKIVESGVVNTFKFFSRLIDE